MRHGQHARAHRSRRAARGSAGDTGGVPRASRRPVKLRLTGQREPELASIGAPEDDEPRPLETLDVLAVRSRGRRVREELRAPRHGNAGERRRQVLEEEGHALEGPVGQPVGDGLAPVIVELHGHGVDGAVSRLDPLDGGLEELARGDLAALHELGQAEGIVLLEIGEALHDQPLRSAGATFSMSVSRTARESLPRNMVGMKTSPTPAAPSMPSLSWIWATLPASKISFAEASSRPMRLMRFC